MKHRIINSGIAAVGLALFPTIAVSVFGSKSKSVSGITCEGQFPGLPGMIAEDNTPLQKTSLLDTQVDGGVRKPNPTGCILLENNFDIENPADLTANASSN